MNVKAERCSEITLGEPSRRRFSKKIQFIALIHVWSIFTCIASLSATETRGCSSSEGLLTCEGINSLSEVMIAEDSSFDKISLMDSDLSREFFKNLSEKLTGVVELSAVRCDLSKFWLEDIAPWNSTLTSLNLSNNRLTESFVLESFPHLISINLSSNQIRRLVPESFTKAKGLLNLDLSGNLLDETLDLKALKELPRSLEYLDISENKFSCSPELSWIYDWNFKRNVIRQKDATECHYENSNYYGNMLLVMEHYSKYIIPSCPIEVGCACALLSVQEKMVVSTDRTYSVQVNCGNRGLVRFPKLPKHTRNVDLSGNFLNGTAFAALEVIDHNYDEVDNLTLDNNKLEILPEKLLEMRLGLSFSAKNNRLTSIPYDFSQRLVQSTTVIELSSNPWKCTCRSQITDLNLIDKIRDKRNMYCGPGSEDQVENKRIIDLDPQSLCAPVPTGEIQELFLQLLCVLLAILIIIVFAKLGYDYWVYRTRGQLPWLVLKMP